MKKAIVVPFLRPVGDAISLDAWRDAAGKEAFTDGIHRTWDPLTDISLFREVELDVARIISDCGLPPDCRLRMSASWYSPGTWLRSSQPAPGAFFDISGRVAHARGSLRLSAPGPRLAGSIAIRTELTLLHPGVKPGDLSPTIAGQILFQDPKRISLEGLGARFPVELVRFPEITKYAGWSLAVSTDLDRPFLGGVRLLINSDHLSVSRAVTADPPCATDRVIGSAIYYDVGRQLLLGALSHTEFAARFDGHRRGTEPFPEGSIGAALAALLQNLFGEHSLNDLRTMRDSNLTGFEDLVKNNLRLFENGYQSSDVASKSVSPADAG